MTWILEGAAVLCLLYYGIIALYSGLSTSFALFWPSMAVVFALLAAGLHYYNKHPQSVPHWLPVSVATFCTACAVIFVAVELMIGWSAIASSRRAAEYVIVLGAKVRGSEVSNSLKKRLDRALHYAENNPNTVLVLSGGQGAGEDISEARAMYDYLQYNGIPESQLLLEEQSVNTVQNIVYSKKVIDYQEKYKAMAAKESLMDSYRERSDSVKIAVLTSNYHVFRAKSIAKKQGIYNVSGIAAPGDPVLAIHMWVREGFAVLKDKFMGKM